mmetsp:Transcript_122663/g.381230  ORF Transcript_122663/g.381230 Transcript_122663/m.381230 type:complete len:723 (-) Transcript_122663:17-2185(-)
MPDVAVGVAEGDSSAAPCCHRVAFAGLCVDCGAEVEPEDDGSSSDSTSTTGFVRPGFVTARPDLRVSSSAVREMEKDTRETLIRDERLVLVLDIDHTLLATCEVKPGAPELPEAELVGSQVLPLLERGRYRVKLRPGLQQFLRSMHGLFQLYLYTQGTVAYAEAVVQLMDPDATFFGRPPRLFARETTPQGLKELTEIFPSDTSIVLVLDDRDEVWPPHVRSAQVVKASPFLAWDNDSRKHISLEGVVGQCQPPPQSGTRRRSSEFADFQLEIVQDTLRKIHSAAFEDPPDSDDGAEESTPSVPRAVQALRASVLQGCVVCLSGIVAGNVDFDRHAVPWWLRAFGAEVEQKLGPRTTHVVTARRDTEKYHVAMQRRAEGESGRLFVVHPGWVLNAIATWRRPAEASFAVPEAGDWPDFLDIWLAPQKNTTRRPGALRRRPVAVAQPGPGSGVLSLNAKPMQVQAGASREEPAGAGSVDASKGGPAREEPAGTGNVDASKGRLARQEPAGTGNVDACKGGLAAAATEAWLARLGGAPSSSPSSASVQGVQPSKRKRQAVPPEDCVEPERRVPLPPGRKHPATPAVQRGNAVGSRLLTNFPIPPSPEEFSLEGLGRLTIAELKAWLHYLSLPLPLGALEKQALIEALAPHMDALRASCRPPATLSAAAKAASHSDGKYAKARPAWASDRRIVRGPMHVQEHSDILCDSDGDIEMRAADDPYLKA